MHRNTIRSLVLLGWTMVFASGCVQVEDGTVGLSKSFGKISDQALTPNLYMSIPLFREVEVWNIKTQRLEKNIDIPSGEGLKVGINTSLLFKPQDVVKLRREVGRDWVFTLLEPMLVDSIRGVVQKVRVEDIIRNQEKLTDEAQKLLVERLSGHGIVIDQLLITGMRLPEKFNEAIELKLQSEQKAIQKEFELRQATKDAEIEVVRAEGSAKAQQIVRSTLSQEYLQYLWISTLNQNPNVIYVATEANMPILRASEVGKKGGAAASASGSGQTTQNPASQQQPASAEKKG